MGMARDLRCLWTPMMPTSTSSEARVGLTLDLSCRDGWLWSLKYSRHGRSSSQLTSESHTAVEVSWTLFNPAPVENGVVDLRPWAG